MLPVATNLRVIKTPWATYTTVAANLLIHLLLTRNTNFIISDKVAGTFGFVPASIANLNHSAIPTLVTSMFLHGDLFHLVGNMVFLLVFGRKVETQLGKLNFSVFFCRRDRSSHESHACGARLIRASHRSQRRHQRSPRSLFRLQSQSAHNIGSGSCSHLFSPPAHAPPARLGFPAHMAFTADLHGPKAARFKRSILGSRGRICGRSPYSRLDLYLHTERRPPSDAIEARSLIPTLTLPAASILKLIGNQFLGSIERISARFVAFMEDIFRQSPSKLILDPFD